MFSFPRKIELLSNTESALPNVCTSRVDKLHYLQSQKGITIPAEGLSDRLLRRNACTTIISVYECMIIMIIYVYL